MTSSRANQPDTAADIQLREILDSTALPGFTMTAGAGSGKTTSLVKALAHVIATRGEVLRKRTQQVACITYTEVAAAEIFTDVGSSPIAHVSTVHSFLWSVVKPFHHDVKTWARSQLVAREDDLVAEQSSFSSRVQQKRRDKVASDLSRTREQLQKIESVSSLRYGLGPDLGNGILGHEDVIKVATEFLLNRPLLATILAKRFPIVFVDESQDTFPEVVMALKHVKAQLGPKFCLGFFGDPMQKVYPRGIGGVALEKGWSNIDKPENFRSPRRVLSVMNHIRGEGDGLKQVSGRRAEDLKEGLVRYFVLPADGQRTQNLQTVRRWLDTQTVEGEWTTDDHLRGAKILVIAHRMAARRLGFENLYSAFHDVGSSSLSQAFDEGTAWPTRLIIDRILPLAEGDTSEQMKRLRSGSPKFDELRRRRTDIETTLAELRAALGKSAQILSTAGPASIGALVREASNSRLVEMDPRLASFLGAESASTIVISQSTIDALTRMMNCDVEELIAYRTHLTEESPYSTHQGVKGAEFERVIVVLDDEEGRHNQFSYEKLFGVKAPSDTDRENLKEGRESVFERTRRLLYVCCSRSTSALAVVFYCSDVSRAVSAMRNSGLPEAGQIMVLAQGGGLADAD